MLIESKEKKSESYRISKNGKTYEVTAREIDNGFIVCIYKSWTEGEGDDKDYKSESTETYYKENPFGKSLIKEEKEDKEDPVKGLKDFMDKMNPFMKY